MNELGQNMLPQPVTTANGNLSVGLPANMDRLNVNVGLHWMLYEKSYRDQAKARRAAKKAKRANKSFGDPAEPAPEASEKPAKARRKKSVELNQDWAGIAHFWSMNNCFEMAFKSAPFVAYI